MKKLPLILISLIIALALAVMIILLIEPYRTKKHQRLAGPLFKEANRLYERGKYARALERYKSIVDKYYKSSYTFGALEKTVEIYDRYHRRGLQVEYLEKFIELFPKRPSSSPHIYKLGEITFMLKGNHEKALKYYSRVIEDFPATQWAKKSQDRVTDIAIQYFPAEKALKYIDNALESMPDGKRRDYLLLKKMEFLWKRGKIQEAYELTAEITRPLRSFIDNNIIFHQLQVREEPTYDNLISLSEVYGRLGFDRKAEEAKRRAERIKGKPEE